MSPTVSRLILVYAGDGGLAAMLADVVKKAFGREDCALCEITYSPLGQRPSWRACEARLGMPVREIHRNELPSEWGLAPAQLPCVLAQVSEERPEVLLTRAEIAACAGKVDELERRLFEALSVRSS